MARLKQIPLDDIRGRAVQSKTDLFAGPGTVLIPVSFGDPYLQTLWREHYVGSAGSMGRQLHYLVYYDGLAVGAISAGSAMFKNGPRDRALGVTEDERRRGLPNIANNTIFRMGRPKDRSPKATEVLAIFQKTVIADWKRTYGSCVRAFETTVEPPRWGGVYKLAGWRRVGKTTGMGARRPKGHGTGNPRKIIKTSKKIVWCLLLMSYHEAAALDARAKERKP